MGLGYFGAVHGDPILDRPGQVNINWADDEGGPASDRLRSEFPVAMPFASSREAIEDFRNNQEQRRPT